jgi:hypothetical protein
VVRGSFFATSPGALDEMRSFEVLWDRRGYFGVGAGNWSLRATCGKFQAYLGEGAFHYLSETYLSSPFIVEMERGQPQAARSAPTLVWRLRYKLLVSLSRELMCRYLEAGSTRARRRYDRLMEVIFSGL